MNLSIISSASNESIAMCQSKIIELVSLIQKHIPNSTIMTGGSLGIPGEIVKQAVAIGIPTICYSPDYNEQSHEKRFDNLSTKYFSRINYIPGFTARSLQMIHDADVVILMNGRIGTLSEFTIALEEGKRVAVITETGGVADHIQYILDIAQKEFPGQVFFSSSIPEIIDWINNKNR